jgi:iron-sulfur cluster assembly accessory protein
MSGELRKLAGEKMMDKSTVVNYNYNELNFTIDEKAKAQLEKLIKINKVFFLTVKKMGCSGFAYDLKQLNKNEIDNNYILIDEEINFFVDKKYNNLLNNITMKWDDSSSFQKNFIFENPNAKNTCGCGESFTDA